MTMTRQFFITTALATLITTPALADLSAAQVWADWQAFAARNGYTLTAASETQAGDILTVSGVTMAMTLPEGDMSGDLGTFTFTELSDGTVAVGVPAEAPLAFSGTGDEGEEFAITLTLRHDGLAMIASGAPGRTLYTYAAPQVSLMATSFEADGEVVPMDLDVTLATLAGEYEIVEGTPMAVRSDLTAGGAAAAFAASDPEGSGDEVRFLATLSDLVSTSTGTMSSFTAMSGLGEMIGQGLTSEGMLSYGSASYEVAGSSDGQDFEVRAGSGAGQLDVSVGEEGLSYGGTNIDLTLAVQASQMPLPDASLAMRSSTWKFDMPVAVSEDPQDFALLLRFDGLTVSDMLWSMFDPMGALSREPATLVLDVAGRANWLVDITDPELAETPLEGVPGEIHALTVNELRLAVAGAELTGTGDFTFDNATVPPAPAGAVDLQLVGGNALLDTLVSMGLLPQEQAMGARMMLGLFARPGAGEDTLTSKIEFTPEGGIIANGQPLR
jgi:hypothetical protein